MKQTSRKQLTAPIGCDMALVTGEADSLLRIVQESFESRITVRGDIVEIEGDAIEVETLISLFSDLFKQAQSDEPPTTASVRRLIELLRSASLSPEALRSDVVLSYRGHVIRPKTAGQKHFLDAIRNHTITFGLGPAGTGKTFLTCAMAVATHPVTLLAPG